MSDTARGTRVLTTGGRAVWVVPSARISVRSPADAARTCPIGAGAVVVGSGDTADLRVDDTSVSGRHFEVLATPEGLLVRDLRSTNGTWIGGRRIQGIYLGGPADIHAGETVFSVEIDAAEQEIEISRATSFGGLLGHAPVMRAALHVLERAAKSDATVLVTGESGTGKELAARALHDRSDRRGGPFVVFDCGAASPTLVEAQLFGHARGAFTGATEAKEGVFEAASGGTLVLDEIGELPLSLQPKLLRAIETRTVVRLGETKVRSVDTRFVASTHRDLAHEAAAGRFRQDLYYRLSVIAVRLPALRERKEEIGRLFRHFLTKLAGDDAPEVPESLIAILTAHDWPGNVRELRNFAERFFVLRDLAPSDLGQSPSPAAVAAPRSPIADPFHEAKQAHIEAFERAYFEALLRAHGDNLSEAARVAGLSRQTCYRLMQKHGLGA